MTNSFSLFRIELRSTPTRWIIPWLIAGGLFVAWSTLIPGVPYWPNVLMASVGSVALTGPATAAAMALVGRRDYQAEMVRKLSVRSTGPLAIAPIAAGATFVIAAHLVVVAVLVVAVGRRGGWGPIDWWAVAAPLAALIVYATLGYLVGRLAPFILTAPALAVGLYVAATVATDRQESWGFLTPYQLHIVDVWSAWRSGFFSQLTLWLVLFAAVLIGLAVVANDRRPMTLAATAGVGVAAALAALGVTARGEVFYEPGIPTFDYVCRGAEPEVCVHPAFAGGTEELSITLNPLNQRLVATPGRIDRLEQRPRGVGQEPGAGSVAFHLDGLSETELSGLVPELVSSRLDQAACSAAVETRPEEAAATDVVSSYLITGKAEPWSGAEALADRLNQADNERRAQWLREHWDQYLTCSLDPDETP